MNSIRTLLLVSLLWLLTGCIQDISPTGVTLRIPASQINADLRKNFPIKRRTPYGTLTLSDPKAKLEPGSDRIVAGATLHYANALIPAQTGTLYLSGTPYFDASKGAIYLHHPRIEELTFNSYSFTGLLKSNIQRQLQPILDRFFASIPIYRLDRGSMSGRFVKDVTVADGALLVRMGL